MKLTHWIFNLSLIVVTGAWSAHQSLAAINTGEDVLKSVQEFRVAANKVINKAQKKGQLKINPDFFVTEGTKLMSLGESLLRNYMKFSNDCNPILEKTISDQQKMTEISIDSLEEQYHHGKAFPEGLADLCYEAKEAIVHPATVVNLAKKMTGKSTVAKSDRQRMANELIEVVAHLENIEILVKEHAATP